MPLSPQRPMTVPVIASEGMRLDDSKQSLLTRALKALEPERKQLIKNRDYMTIKSQREGAIQEVARIKKLQLKKTLKVQAVENEKLQHASKIAIARLDSECDKQVTEAESEWGQKLKHLEVKHEKEASDLERSLREKESQRRNIHSTYVRDLQFAEKRLAQLHEYEDCAMTRAKIKQKEQEELRDMEKVKEERIQDCLQRLRDKQDEERRFAITKMRNAMAIARSTCESQKQINQYLFQNKNLQMYHAHTVERNTKISLEDYARPHWIKLPDRDRQAATSRGSQVFLQQVGDKYCIPSLCDMYGDKTQEELTPPIPASRKKHLLY